MHVAYSFLFVLFRTTAKWYSYLFVYCRRILRKEREMERFPWCKPFLHVQLNNYLFTMLEKSVKHMLDSLINVLIINFLMKYFILRFYFTWWFRLIKKHFLLKTFLTVKLTDTIYGVTLYPEVILYSQILIFFITEFFLKIPNHSNM